MPHEDIYRNGRKLVSVTQIPAVVAKVFLDKWRIKLCHCDTHKSMERKTPFKESELKVINRMGPGHCGFAYGDNIKDNAAELGTEVHEIIDNWFKGLEVKGTPEAMGWVNKIIPLYEEHGVKPHIIQPEQTLVDEESGLNGSPDHPIVWDGNPAIADLKIKNQLDDFTGVQGWLYRYLIRRKYGFDFKYMMPIWCKKESKNKDVEPVLIDLDEWREPSIACVTIWNKLNPKRQVRIIE